MGNESLFYPKELIERAKANAVRYPWAAAIQQEVVKAAAPWLEFSDEELWQLMFGNTLRRSWMVWSNGHCPACRGGVPMYNWRIEAHARPWKLQCPHCRELFPKNDFHAFYRSGLDERHVFDPGRADRALLFNPEHPDPGDPLHRFGVDDGEGYRDGEHTWWFVGTYLIYGQWKQLVHAGIRNLAAAYVATGERLYAHKAGVLLDRVADLYPSFDFKEEGVMYEGPAHAGYVSTWHDACEETREMALAFDQIRAAIAADGELAAFLSGKAARYGSRTPKAGAADILRNIEAGILRDPIANPDRIRTNYPRREIALVVLKTVLDWPRNRDEVNGMVDEMVERATAVDGVTGEKGLAGYTAYVIHGLAQFLEQYARLDPAFLGDLARRHPNLLQTYRFHIDTWCLQQYYPQSGDTGAFAQKSDRYIGAPFTRHPGLLPSMFSLFWRLYQLTGDAAYVQVLYHENGRSIAELPHDLFAEDPAAFQARVGAVIDAAGDELELDSVNKPKWHLAVLRSGKGRDRRAVWLDYDSGGGHGHLDGMNLGLFAKGLDLLPEYGYPPVQYGGWAGPKFHWYLSTAAHNTVVVDGKDQERPADGRHTLWGAGPTFRAIRAAGQPLYRIRQYERTLVMADLSAADFYVLDIFRVAGGSDHAKFMHSHFGSLDTRGLSLEPGEEYGFGTQMRGFRADLRPRPGWHADWRIEDRLGYADPGADLHLRYTDLTEGAEVHTAEGWIAMGTSTYEETWIPRLMVRRRGPGPELASTFAGVLEPYAGRPNLTGIRRLPLRTRTGDPGPAASIAVEVGLADGGADLIVAADVETGGGPAADGVLVEPTWGVELVGELAAIRRTAAGVVTRAALWRGRAVRVGSLALELTGETEFVEIEIEGGNPRIASGEGRLAGRPGA
jgi:oligo-alginate lyase